MALIKNCSENLTSSTTFFAAASENEKSEKISLPEVFKLFRYFEKHGSKGADLVSLLCIYSESLTILLVQKYYFNLKIVWHTCSLGDPLLLIRIYRNAGPIRK